MQTDRPTDRQEGEGASKREGGKGKNGETRRCKKRQ